MSLSNDPLTLSYTLFHIRGTDGKMWGLSTNTSSNNSCDEEWMERDGEFRDPQRGISNPEETGALSNR